MSSKRKQVYLAVAGSVGIHLVVLFAWALSVQWFPGAQAATSQPPDEIKLQIVEEKAAETPPPPDLEAARPTPTPTPRLVYQDTDDLPEAKEAPKNPVAQSSRNTEAASEMPPTGDQPLPSQTGRKVPRFAFDTRPYVEGDARPTAGQSVAENMPPPDRLTAPPPPRPVSTPPPPGTPPPTATPAPANVDPRDLAMVTPRSLPTSPADAEPNPYDPAFRPPADMTEPPRPTPVPRRGGYQAQQARTNAVGSITKSGASSVSSRATPAARYVADVTRAVNHRYHQLVDARADMISLGTVKVAFLIDRDGKVRASRVVANSANEALAGVTLRALAEAPIPPMPADVAPNFDGGIMPMMIIFDLD